jgi:hypothetical protein
MVGDGQVGIAIAIEVADGNRPGCHARRNVDCRGKPSIAVAQQHGNGVVVELGVGNGQIEVAVAVEIAHPKRPAVLTGGEIAVRLEAAAAVPQQQGDIAREPIG